MKSSQINRLILVLAAAIGLVGLLLKLTESDPSENAGGPHGKPAETRTKSDTSTAAAGHRGEEAPAALARVEGGSTEMPAGSAPPGADGGAPPVVGPFEAGTPAKLERRDGSLEHPTSATPHRQRGQRRERGRGTSSGLEVATAGSGAAGGLGATANGASPAAGPVAAGPGQANGQPANGQAADDKPPLPPDVAYDSGDATLF